MVPTRAIVIVSLAACAALAWGPARIAAADQPSIVKGTFTANGAAVDLPFVYAYAEKEGFYDPADPTWTLLFVAREIPARELDDHIWDAAYLRLGITRTAEFDDAPTFHVYSQDMRLTADQGGNLSGGSYPELELTAAGPDRFTGRVWQPELQEFFDDTYQYDLSFDVPLSDPSAPIGEPLPAGGGEPGEAYVAWVAAIQSGDVARIRKLLPAEQAAMLDGEGVADQLAMMKEMTPSDVTVTSGSSDGETAILMVSGTMDGGTVEGEITLERTEGHWLPVSESWQ